MKKLKIVDVISKSEDGTTNVIPMVENEDGSVRHFAMQDFEEDIKEQIGNLWVNPWETLSSKLINKRYGKVVLFGYDRWVEKGRQGLRLLDPQNAEDVDLMKVLQSLCEEK